MIITPVFLKKQQTKQNSTTTPKPKTPSGFLWKQNFRSFKKINYIFRYCYVYWKFSQFTPLNSWKNWGFKAKCHLTNIFVSFPFFFWILRRWWKGRKMSVKDLLHFTLSVKSLIHLEKTRIIYLSPFKKY